MIDGFIYSLSIRLAIAFIISMFEYSPIEYSICNITFEDRRAFLLIMYNDFKYRGHLMATSLEFLIIHVLLIFNNEHFLLIALCFPDFCNLFEIFIPRPYHSLICRF